MGEMISTPLAMKLMAKHLRRYHTNATHWKLVVHVLLYKVREYAAIFWERKEELEDHDRIMALIEKGEQKIQRKKDIRNALDTKVQSQKQTVANIVLFNDRCHFIEHPFINSILSMGQTRGKTIQRKKTDSW